MLYESLVILISDKPEDSLSIEITHLGARLDFGALKHAFHLVGSSGYGVIIDLVRYIVGHVLSD